MRSSDGRHHGAVPARRSTRLSHDLGGWRKLSRGLAELLGVQLVEMSGEPLGQPAGVGEDDGRAVLSDEVQDLVLDVRPDRRRPTRWHLVINRGRRLDGSRSRGCAQIAHVLDRDHDREVPGFDRRWGNDLNRVGSAQESSDPLRRPDSCRQPDPLNGPRPAGVDDQLVQPFQGQCQVSAPLGPGQRVHLIDDDGLHVSEHIAS